MISRELYRAAVEAYIQHLRFKRDVAKEVQRLMGISGPFVLKENRVNDETFLELIIAAADDKYGITRKLLNNEGFYKDDHKVIAIPIRGDELMEFQMNDLDDAFDCIAALRVVR